VEIGLKSRTLGEINNQLQQLMPKIGSANIMLQHPKQMPDTFLFKLNNTVSMSQLQLWVNQKLKKLVL